MHALGIRHTADAGGTPVVDRDACAGALQRTERRHGNSARARACAGSGSCPGACRFGTGTRTGGSACTGDGRARAGPVGIRHDERCGQPGHPHAGEVGRAEVGRRTRQRIDRRRPLAGRSVGVRELDGSGPDAGGTCEQRGEQQEQHAVVREEQRAFERQEQRTGSLGEHRHG